MKGVVDTYRNLIVLPTVSPQSGTFSCCRRANHNLTKTLTFYAAPGLTDKEGQALAVVAR